MPRNNDDAPRNRPWDKGGRDRDEEDDRPRRRRDEEDERDDEDDRPRRRRRDDEDDFDDDRPRRRRRDEEAPNGLATAALILGILSLCTGPLVGLPALVCGIIARGRPGGKSSATAGIVLGALGILMLPIMIGLLLPAVQKVRESAARMNDSNNLKHLGVGMHNYVSVNSQFPPADGQLSWRFHVLPYIEQANLYQSMNAKEPWDGPTNKRYTSTRVKAFVSAFDPPESADTRYRVFVGPDTIFPPGRRPVALFGITDGTSNTILVVESADTVPWSQPKELPYTRGGPIPALGVPNRPTTQVLMADGSVRPFSANVSPDVIRGGIEPNDGKPFNP